jgi:hypothetical protein
VRLGIRIAHDPSWAYRVPREDVVRAMAIERADILDAEDRGKVAPPGSVPVPPRKAGTFLALPQVATLTPEAARFWGAP